MVIPAIWIDRSSTFRLFTGVIVNKFYNWAITRNDLFSLGMYGILILPMLEIFLPESQMLILLASMSMFVLFFSCSRIKKRSSNIENNKKILFDPQFGFVLRFRLYKKNIPNFMKLF